MCKKLQKKNYEKESACAHTLILLTQKSVLCHQSVQTWEIPFSTEHQH